MTEFRKLSETFFASPQINIEDLEAAKALGIRLIINNRPDGEDPAAPQSSAIQSAAEGEGLSYVEIPIGHSGMSETQIDALIEALQTADGASLAYCRSGTRSTFLWALSQAKTGSRPDDIVQSAMAAGYDVTPIRPMIDMLSSR